MSDLSGKEIVDPKRGATVVVTFNDPGKGVVRLDVLVAEVADLVAKGSPQKRRGRPKSQA